MVQLEMESLQKKRRRKSGKVALVKNQPEGGVTTVPRQARRGDLAVPCADSPVGRRQRTSLDQASFKATEGRGELTPTNPGSEGHKKQGIRFQ